MNIIIATNLKSGSRFGGVGENADEAIKGVAASFARGCDEGLKGWLELLDLLYACEHLWIIKPEDMNAMEIVEGKYKIICR